MEVDYDFPGTVNINLNARDLVELNDRGFTIERDGFSGIDSKVWVHLDPIDPNISSSPNDNHADIETGGDLHVRLKRGLLFPVVIEQSRIDAADGLVTHYLGNGGSVIVGLSS